MPARIPPILLKLGFSGTALVVQLARQPELRSKTLSDRPFLEFMQFLVPSAIYFANNNLAFVILQVAAPCPLPLPALAMLQKPRMVAIWHPRTRIERAPQTPALRSRSIRQLDNRN